MATRSDVSDPVLLGSADRPWPEPGCRCRACRAGDGTGRAAAALRVGSITVGGRPGAPTVRQGGAAAVPVGAGDALQHDGVRVVGLPGPGGVMLVVGSASGTLLWCPLPDDDGGNGGGNGGGNRGGNRGGAGAASPAAFAELPDPTLDALADAELTVATLGVGPADPGGGPCALGLARLLAQLRQVRALADGCDVVAVGLSHRTAPSLVQPYLARWGARVAPDGAPLGPEHAARPCPPAPRTLVLGAASSGKSAVAEALLAAEPDVDYLPTGLAPSDEDADWAARVQLHRQRRPAWWRTLEATDPARALLATGAPLLLDSVGTWVAGALDRCGAWDDAPGWSDRFDREVDAVVHAWRQAARVVVAVGEEAGWGVVPATSAGRRFRDALGRVNRRLAAESEQLLLVAAGRVVELSEGVGDV